MIRMSQETITPERAKQYLEKAKINRKLSATAVKSYMAAMTSGLWEVNGETIKFNEDGGLIDGQHRLTACVESGMPFTTCVVREIQVYNEIDIGKKRTLADALMISTSGKMAGPTALSFSGALTALCSYASESRAVEGYQRSSVFTHAFKLQFVINDIHFQRILPRCEEYIALKSNPLRPSTAVAILWLASVAESDFEKVRGFLNEVRDGLGLADGDPSLAYRNFIIASAQRKRLLTSKETFRIAVAAISKHLAGQRVSMVKSIAYPVYPNASPEKVRTILGIE